MCYLLYLLMSSVIHLLDIVFMTDLKSLFHIYFVISGESSSIAILPIFYAYAVSYSTRKSIDFLFEMILS